MGDGKKLKEYLDEKGTNVRRIAKETGISATTLYTIIQKDSNIRFDFALRLANALDIDVNEICSASPFSGAITEEEIYPTLPDGLNGALDASRVKTYLKNSLYPLMYLFGKNSMPDVDNLLTSFHLSLCIYMSSIPRLFYIRLMFSFSDRFYYINQIILRKTGFFFFCNHY